MTPNLRQSLEQLQHAIGVVLTAAAEEPVRAQAAALPLELPHLLHADEAAALLRVNKSTVYRMARSGELPHVRLGTEQHAVRFERDALLDWIRQRRSDVRPRMADAAVTPMPSRRGRLKVAGR